MRPPTPIYGTSGARPAPPPPGSARAGWGPNWPTPPSRWPSTPKASTPGSPPVRSTRPPAWPDPAPRCWCGESPPGERPPPGSAPHPAAATAPPPLPACSRPCRPTGGSWPSPRRRPTWWPATPTGPATSSCTTGRPRATTRVSVGPQGAEADGPSLSFPFLSADGRFVTFSSDATNLVTGDNNGVGDVYVHDRQTGTTSRVSVGAEGVEANGPQRAAVHQRRRPLRGLRVRRHQSGGPVRHQRHP